MPLKGIFGLSIGLCLAIGSQAQPSKAGEQTGAPQKKQQATSRAKPAKSPGPFDSLTQFSATMIGSLAGNSDDAKIYRSGKLLRVESWNHIDYFVTNLSTHDTYTVLNPPKKKNRCVYNNVLAVQTFPFSFFRPEFQIQRTADGEGDVEGHHCHIESVVRTSPSGSEVHVRFWEADDLNGFPVKIEVDRPGGKAVTISYKDVKLGPPDPALFVLPKSCSRPLKGPER